MYDLMGALVLGYFVLRIGISVFLEHREDMKTRKERQQFHDFIERRLEFSEVGGGNSQASRLTGVCK